MPARLKTSFFYAANPQGRALRDAFMETLAREFGLAAEVVEAPGQQDVDRSCRSDDLVVFDASIEEGNLYAAATSQPMTMDRVLVVSRTYLPLNFYGLREGGAPDFPRRTTQTNEEILAWLRGQLRDLAEQPARPEDRKGFVGSWRYMRESLKRREADWKSRGRIFISYRSRHLTAARELASRVGRGDFHGGEPRTAYMLPPGELVYEDEILSEMRHWQLVSMIDRKVGAADELWVYETEDYYDSWWTRAELLTIAYRRASGIYAPRVRVFDPARTELRDLPEDALPELSKKQAKRMARWYANTDPGMIAPEALTAIRFYSKLPLLGRLPYFHDHVWSEEFWFNNILPCERCGAREPRPELKDIEAFLWLRDPKMVRLPRRELEEALERGAVICPGCLTIYPVSQSPHLRYLWIPLRAQGGPYATHLLELPIIRVGR